jgi:SAM-dependent methyltransferase
MINNKNYTKLTNTINLLKVSSALNDPIAVDFVKKIIKYHYKNIFFKEEIENIVDKVFDILTNNQNYKNNILSLKMSMTDLIKLNYFKDIKSPFFEKYQNYKKLNKPAYYFNEVNNDILGKKILDFGCGKGYNSAYFSTKGYDVLATDVVDYLETKNVNFIKIEEMNDILNLPKTDTAIIFTVLHHIDKENINEILSNMSKVVKRLIIIEDTYDLEYFSNTITFDNESKLLLSIPEKSRLNAILLTDFYGNVITQSLTNINLSFQFKKVNEWTKILKNSGFQNIKVEAIGFPKISFHGFFQIKIICDSKKT